MAPLFQAAYDTNTVPNRRCLQGINAQVRAGSWVGPTKGRVFKLDFPSANFWAKIFFGWVGLRANSPPPPHPPPINKAWYPTSLDGVGV